MLSNMYVVENENYELMYLIDMLSYLFVRQH
jgi:hypothetical protein